MKVVIFLICLICFSAFANAKLILRLDKSTKNEHSVSFTLVAQSDLQLLPWGTPLEDRLRASIFHLEDENGNTCEWQGAVYRRQLPATEPKFFMSLSEGYSITIDYDLAELYNCHDAPRSHYTVTLQFPVYAFTLPSGEYPEIEFFDEGVSVEWHPAHAQVPKILSAAFIERPSESVTVLGNTYQNCNSQEQSQVASAVPAAQSQATNGYNCMAKGQSGCALAKTWFGTYSSTNWNYDQGSLNNIKNRLAGGMAAYCNPSGCSQGVYAYVYPTQCCTVYLCSVFWSIPSERAETIVHEESHFNANSITGRGTQDYAYGRTNCKNLAKSDPTKASNNADNVCYFAAGYA